ncbi:MAG: cytochrome c [Pseudolabrys sp.]|nr:cytochrome c [Pseudolabrys sp.]
MSECAGRRTIVALAVAAVAAGLAPAARADDAAAGAAEFKARCAACHGETGAGDGPAAAALRSPPPDLRQLARNNDGVFPEKVLETVIDGRKTIRAHGNFEMPVWGRELSQASGDADAARRVSAVVRFLRDIQQK